ncbi:MAG: asparagine synthase (glutamine-hydrolyzing) [Bryobacterales bacterium]|nr:asparagine synthase (glutamine-hydrolyzing) [Bryobacterales bacterium]
MGIVAEQPSGTILLEMAAAVRHRGPEGLYTRCLGQAHFAYQQLAFVAVGRAEQPYASADERLLVVFNGEIYNHAELRRDYGADNQAPGEAPVLLSLYRRFGPAFPSLLNGMFAIAIYDREAQSLYLARDRFGKKPLYYHSGPAMLFASELSALRRHPACPAEIDIPAVAQYVSLNAVPGPHTLLRGVHKVPAGGWLLLRAGTMRSETYWQIALQREKPAAGIAEAECELEKRLTKAVERRLPSEAACGVFLSGGLDSAILAAMAARQGVKLPAFSAAFPANPSFDESEEAAATAQHLGLPHSVVSMPLADLAAAAMQVLPAMDEPVADHSLLPTALLAGHARQSVKAVFTGDGADELLMGYRLFALLRVLQGVQRVATTALAGAALQWLANRRPAERNLSVGEASRHLARALRHPPEHQYYRAAGAFPQEDWADLFTAEAREQLQQLAPYAAVDSVVSRHGNASAAERLQLGMMQHFLRDVILTKLDRATMSAGLEARSPFLDADLVDFLLTLPPQWKLRGLTGKYLLRRMARRYLPPAVADRRKRGFRVPVSALLRGPLRGFLRDHLDPTIVSRQGLFHAGYVRRLVEENEQGRDHHRRLWSLLCFQCWRQGWEPNNNG